MAMPHWHACARCAASWLVAKLECWGGPMTELTEAVIRIQILRTGRLIWAICGVSLTVAAAFATLAFSSTGLSAGILSFVSAMFAFVSYHSAGWAIRFARDARMALSSLPRYRGDLPGFERNFGYLMHIRNIGHL